MKILVAVKRVVDAKIKVRPLPDHSGVDVKLAKMAMNPFDEIAIEKAVTLREAGVADFRECLHFLDADAWRIRGAPGRGAVANA